MKRNYRFIFRLILVVCLIMFLSVVTYAQQSEGTTYYVSSSLGNDMNSGTSEETPWQTLEKVSSIEFQPGDTILLKSGDIWEEELILHGNGSVDRENNVLQLITLSSYGSGNRPIIRPGGIDKTCLTVNGLEGWAINNLELCDAYQGILLAYHDVFEKDYISISNCYIHSINRQFNSNPQENGRYKYNHFSSGIAVRGWMEGSNGFVSGTTNLPIETPPEGSTHLSRLIIDNVVFEDCDAGIWMCKDDIANAARMGYFTEAQLSNLTFRYCGMWGYSLKNLYNSTVINCDCYDSGTVPVWCGSCSGLVESCIKVVLDGCDIYYANRDPEQIYDGCGFDFEAWNYDVTYKNAIIDGTDGCGIFVFDNGLGNINDKLTITGCTIKNSGMNCGNTCAGVDFTAKLGSEGGICTNNTLYCTSEKSLFVAGNTSDWTFSDNTYHYCENVPVWDFNNYSLQEWTIVNSVNYEANQQTISVIVSGKDPYLKTTDTLCVNAGHYQSAILKMKNNTSDTEAKLYWITEEDLVWDEAKSVTITLQPEDDIFTPYHIDLSANENWTGTIVALRIDPVDNISTSITSGGGTNCDVEIDSFRLCTDPDGVLYPAERSEPTPADMFETPIVWDFAGEQSLLGWSEGNSVGTNVTEHGLEVTTNGVDPYIVSAQNLGLNINCYNTVKIRLANNSAESKAKLYWITNQDLEWNESKSVALDLLPIASGEQEYVLYLRDNPKWKGQLYQLRLDTMEMLSGTSVGSVLIKSISICEEESATEGWQFNSDGNSEGWTTGNSVTGTVQNGSYSITISGQDPYVFSPDNLGINMDAMPYLQITLKNETLDWAGRVYWTTTTDTTWSEAKSCSFALKNADNDYRTYVIDFGSSANWTGTLKQLRLDVVDNVSSGTVFVDKINFISHPENNYAAWTFSTENSTDEWLLTNHVSGSAVGGSLNLSVNGSDPYVHSPDFLNLDMEHCRYIRIDMTNATYATEARIFWTTSADQNWSESKSETITLLTGQQNLNSYIIDLGSHANWSGVLKQLRFDFVDQLTAGNVNIDAIYVY